MLFKNIMTVIPVMVFLAGCGSSVEANSSEKAQQVVQASTITADDIKAENKHILDGTTIDWTYRVSGSGMILSFENGLAEYEWVRGSRKGRRADNIAYQSRKIGDDMYLINWVQPEKPDFITLIFDFKNNVAFSSGLIGYGTERQKNLFMDGFVHSVER